jgi:hypothetical protein
MFCLPQYIDSSAAVIFGELHDEDCLHGLRRDALSGGWPITWAKSTPCTRSARATGGRSVPSSGSSPATPGSRSPGSTLISPATSRPPSRSYAATPNRCARCWTRSREAAPDHPSYARRQAQAPSTVFAAQGAYLPMLSQSRMPPRPPPQQHPGGTSTSTPTAPSPGPPQPAAPTPPNPRATPSKRAWRTADGLAPAAYLGGRPRPGRMGAICDVGCRRGPDHKAGAASMAAATA